MAIVRIALAALTMYLLLASLGKPANTVEEQEQKDTEYLVGGEEYEMNSVFCKQYHALDDYLIELVVYGLLSAKKKFELLQTDGTCEESTRVVRIESIAGGRFWRNGNTMLFIVKTTELESGTTWYLLSSLPVVVIPNDREIERREQDNDRGSATAFPLCF